jgi:hypothetical protein
VVASWWCGQRAHLRRLVAGFAAGALATIALAVVWVELHGTSPAAVLGAMYAFRVRAGELLLHGAGWEHARPRATLLLLGWVVAGLAGLTLALAVNVRRWARSPVMVALSVTAVFDLASVALGGGYWGHYLIQTVVPLSIAAGVLAARASVSAVCAVVASIVLTSVPAVFATTAVPTTSTADVIGTSIRQASRPGDTLVTLYGQPQVNLAAGLPSPYPHLWSLPAKTLDPRLSHLDAVLTGPRAPTWLVVLQKVGSWGLDTRRIARVVAHRYSPVAHWRGQTIYLRDGVSRPPPAPDRVSS